MALYNYYYRIKISENNLQYFNSISKRSVDKYYPKSFQYLVVCLLRWSSSSFLPSFLFAEFFRNLSLFHAWFVCWNKDTGSFFFFDDMGVFNLNVYAAVRGLTLLVTFVLAWVYPDNFCSLNANILGLRVYI